MVLPAVRDQFALAKQGGLRQLNQGIVDLAKWANAGIMALEPKPVGYVRVVDGSVGLPEEAVKPNGIIVYKYQRLDIVIQFALETLRTLSPRLTGAYQEAHTVFINHSPAQAPYVISSADDVMISNTEPYARKVEVGHMKMKVPGTDHVYQQAQQIVNREYQGIVSVEFNYVPLPSADALAGRFTKGIQPQSRKRLQKDTRRGATHEFPALLFKLK